MLIINAFALMFALSLSLLLEWLHGSSLSMVSLTDHNRLKQPLLPPFFFPSS